MKGCWESKPEDRPTFSRLVYKLVHFLGSLAEYFDLAHGSLSPTTDGNLWESPQEAESVFGAEPETELAGSRTELAARSETELAARSETELAARSETELEARSETNLKAESGTDLKAESGTDLKAESGTDLKAESGTKLEVES